MNGCPSLLLGFWALVAAVGCTGDEGLRYEGDTGQPQTLRFAGDAPMVEAKVSLGEAPAVPTTLLVDTGAPATVLSTHAFSLSPGWHGAALDALGLRFPDRKVGAMGLFAKSPCDPSPAGILGGDVLSHFALEVDYEAGHLTLDGPPLSGAETLAVELAGGGTLQLAAGSGSHPVGATRMLVEVEIEGRRATALIDTGASLTVLSKGLLAQLGNASRPQACCQGFATQSGAVSAPVFRLAQVKIGSLTLEQVPATVLDEAALFTPLSVEVGRAVELLIGGSVLRHLVLRIDGRAGELALRRGGSSQVASDEWILPGFAHCRGADGRAYVVDVYQGTDGAAKGIRPGDRLLQVDGKSVESLDPPALRQALRGGGAGSTVKLRVGRGGNEFDLEVRIDDVLPRS